MKRTFLVTAELGNFTNKFSNGDVSKLVEGIQIKGGDVLSVAINKARMNPERLLIFYDDGGNEEEILNFLNNFIFVYDK